MSFDDLKNSALELSESELEQVVGAGGGGWGGGCCGFGGGCCGWGGGCCGFGGGWGGCCSGPFIIAQQSYFATNYALTYNTVASNSFVTAYLN